MATTTPQLSLEVTRRGTVLRSGIIAAVQFIGAASILISWWFYSHEWRVDWFMVTLSAAAALSGAVFAILSTLNWLAGSRVREWIRRPLDPNPIQIEEVVIKSCRNLILLDAVIAGLLIGLTGGITTSFYGPLGSSLYTTAMTLRLPRRILAQCLLGTTALAAAGIIIAKRYCASRYVLGGDYETAILVNLFVATAVTVVVGADQFFLNAPEEVFSAAFERLSGSMHTNRAHDARRMERALRLFAIDVRRTIQGCNLSVVHDPLVPVEQSIILSLPFRSQEDEVLEPVTYMTFASHWFDDLCDNVLVDFHGVRYHDSQSLDRFIYQNPHLRCVCHRIERRMGVGRLLFAQRKFFSSPHLPRKTGKHDVGSKPLTFQLVAQRAFRRVLLAALMQRCHDRPAIVTILDCYVKVVTECDWVRQEIKDAYQELHRQKNWLALWATGKCVLDLFESASNRFDPNCSELYSILFGPFLISQNIDQEFRNEHVTPTFKDMIIGQALNGHLPSTLFQPAIGVFRQNISIVTDQHIDLRRGRADQIHALLQVYGTKLDEPTKQAYLAIAAVLYPSEGPSNPAPTEQAARPSSPT